MSHRLASGTINSGASSTSTVAPRDPNSGPDLGPVVVHYNGRPVEWRKDEGISTDGAERWRAVLPKP